MERVQNLSEWDRPRRKRLKFQMKQAERTELRAEQLSLIQQGYGICAELEGLQVGYQGIVDEGKSPARKCALRTLRKMQEALRGWEYALKGLEGGSSDAMIAENGKIRLEIARLKQIAQGKAGLLQTLKMQLRNYHIQCLNDTFQRLEDAALAIGINDPDGQTWDRKVRERKRAQEFENDYRRIKNEMRELRRRADIANYVDGAFERIDRALNRLRREPDSAALQRLEICDVQPLANRLRKYEKDAQALDDKLSRHLAVYDALCEETGLRPVKAFPFCEESISEIDAVCDRLLHSAGKRGRTETEGVQIIRAFGAAAEESRYERYRNRKRKYRET